ncbi:MAG TPA: CPBP family intramembrane glutamic endopeptidase [Candidatus Eisenbacteria bacterium]|nr:CPBP family intramembrane glutamic endopeptidase [Candidatus Eisenbacteria bacterium]
MMIPHVPAAHAPGLADHALIVLMALLALAEAWWYWPRIMRALADRVPGTRTRVYRNIIVLEWAFAAAVVAQWVAQHRAWAALHVGPGRPVATAVGAVFVAGYLALALVQIRAVVADPERLVRFAARQAKTDPLAPRTADDQRLFVVLSLTAGLCEEFFYRGFALWYFTQLAGAVAGFALAAVLFGLVHLYLGRMHAVRAAIVGVVFGLLVIGTGSLWPAIVLHAAMDLLGGAFGARAFRAAEQHATAAAS